MKIIKLLLIPGICCLFFVFLAISGSEKNESEYFPVDSCTDIIVGKDASVVGSVI